MKRLTIKILALVMAILLILPVSLLSFIFYVFRGFYNPDVLIPTALGVTAADFLGRLFCKNCP